jgi:flagella basal body P-ring formation protein FlgA
MRGTLFVLTLLLVHLPSCFASEDRPLTLQLKEHVALPYGPVYLRDLIVVPDQPLEAEFSTLLEVVITSVSGKSHLRIEPTLIRAAYRSQNDQRFPVSVIGSAKITLAEQVISGEAIQQAIDSAIPNGGQFTPHEPLLSWRIGATRAPARLQARCLNARHSGGTAIVLSAHDPLSDREIDRTIIQGDLAFMQTVLITLHDLPAGHILTARDITAAQQPAISANQKPTQAADFFGKQLRRAVAAGTTLQPALLTAPWMVNARQTVTIQWRSPTFIITSRGKALTNGSLGEHVQIIGHQGEKLHATVVGPNLVQIGPN